MTGMGFEYVIQITIHIRAKNFTITE
jgi:hypothetical protein